MSANLNTLKNVPVDKIDILPGLNKRVIPEDYENDPEINALAVDISENGLANPIRVVPSDNDRYTVVAGHRRTLAVRLANSKYDAGIKSMMAIVTREMTDETKHAIQLADVHSKRLKPLEAAEALRWFMNNGMSQTEIAKRFKLTVAYAGDLKLLSDASEVVKEAVREDVVAATEAVRLVKEYGEEGAQEILKEAVEEAQATTLPAATPGAAGEGAVAAEMGDPAATPAITRKRRTKATNDAVAKAKNIAPKRPKQPKREVPSEAEAQSVEEILTGTMIRVDRLIAMLKIGNDEEVRRVHVELAYKLRDYLTAGHKLGYDGEAGTVLSGMTPNTPDEEIEFMGEPQAESKAA